MKVERDKINERLTDRDVTKIEKVQKLQIRQAPVGGSGVNRIGATSSTAPVARDGPLLGRPCLRS